MIFRYRAKAGYAQDEGFLPINEKFYLGGVNSVRGFQNRSITPRDKDGLRIGGKQMFYNTAELSYGMFETVQMRFLIFYDYGMIGQKILTILSVALLVLELNGFLLLGQSTSSSHMH